MRKREGERGREREGEEERGRERKGEGERGRERKREGERQVKGNELYNETCGSICVASIPLTNLVVDSLPDTCISFQFP